MILTILAVLLLADGTPFGSAFQVKRSWELSNLAKPCTLPRCPMHASYEVTNVMQTWNGEKWPTEVVFTCWPGYTLVGSRIIECYDGRWSDHTPECVDYRTGCLSDGIGFTDFGYEGNIKVSSQGQQQFVSHMQQFVPHQHQSMLQPQQSVSYPQHNIPQPQLPLPNPQQSAPYPQQNIPQPQLPLPNPQQSAPYPQQNIPQPVSQTRPFIPQQSCVNCCSCDDIGQMKQPLPQPQQAIGQPQTLQARGEQLKKTSEATGGCILPPYPGNGTYKLTTVMNPIPSNQRLTANLTYTCNPEKIREGPLFIICLAGKWSDNFPYCRERRPGDPTGSSFSVGGTAATLSELPWHVGIYDKSFMPYMQICGGSVISRNRVISAAHCFWEDLEMLQPASQFAVGAGKLFRAWDDQRDTMNAQQVDVRDIKIPPRYQHLTASYQEDIALLTVTTDFTFNSFVMPAILDFNPDLDSKHLQEGNLGTVGGWGLITEDGKEATVLQVVMLPYVGIEKCIAENEPGFRNYITADKICAGFRNGTAVCVGDSGGGLVFTEEENGNQRYYLRGIVSTAPTSDNACNIYAWTTFTHLLRQDHFIQPLIAA